MSLLLDALKRAEDAKRAKAGAAAETPATTEKGDAPSAESAAVEGATVTSIARGELAPASTARPNDRLATPPNYPILSREVVNPPVPAPLTLSSVEPAVPPASASGGSADRSLQSMTMEELLASELGSPPPKKSPGIPTQPHAATAAFRAARTASQPESDPRKPESPALELFSIEPSPRDTTIKAETKAMSSTPAESTLTSANREAIKNAFAVKQSTQPGGRAKWIIPLIVVLLSGLAAGAWYMWSEMTRFSRPGTLKTAPMLPAKIPPQQSIPPGAPAAAPVAAQAAAPPAPATTAANAGPTSAPDVDAPLPPLLPPPATQLREAPAVTVAKAQAISTPREALARRVEALPPFEPNRAAAVKLTPARPAADLQILPALSAGYAALSAGDYALAKSRYAEAIATNGNNLDAHLGFATAAARGGDAADLALAVRHYRRVLELDPRNSTANAALIVLAGDTGTATDRARRSTADQESALRQLISRDPMAANAHFLLGNLYAEARRWREAQQAYFEAARLQPQNADYSYNLAVSLDHLGQGPAAADFYKRALAATTKGQFDAAVVNRRIAALSDDPAARGSAAQR